MGLRGLCGLWFGPRENSITGSLALIAAIHYFLLWVNFIEGFKQIESDKEVSILICQKSCDNQINNGTVSVGWFSPGWLPLSDHPGQKTQRKILGFKPAEREAGVLKCSALQNQPIVQIAITNKNI